MADTDTPPPLTRGPKWAREAYNRLLAFAIKERVVSINRDAGELTPFTSGKLLKVIPNATVAPHPFHVSAAGANAHVTYGTVNGIAPIEMSGGNHPSAIIPLNPSDTLIWLQVDTDSDHNVSEVSIDHGTVRPDDDEEGGTYYLALANVVFDSGSFFVSDNLTGSQAFSMCRNWFSNPATYGATWSVV